MQTDNDNDELSIRVVMHEEELASSVSLFTISESNDLSEVFSVKSNTSNGSCGGSGSTGIDVHSISSSSSSSHPNAAVTSPATHHIPQYHLTPPPHNLLPPPLVPTAQPLASSSSSLISTLKNRIISLEDEQSTMTVEYDSMLSAKDEEIRKLRCQLKELNERCNKSLYEANKAEAVTFDLDRVMYDNNQLKCANEELQKQVDKTMTDNTRLQSNCNLLMNDCERLKVELIAIKTSHDSIASERDQIRIRKDEEANISSNEKKRLEELCIRLNDDAIACDRKMSSLEKECHSMRKRLSDNDILEHEYSNARKHIVNLESDRKSLLIELDYYKSSSQQQHTRRYSMPTASYQDDAFDHSRENEPVSDDSHRYTYKPSSSSSSSSSSMSSYRPYSFPVDKVESVNATITAQPPVAAAAAVESGKSQPSYRNSSSKTQDLLQPQQQQQQQAQPQQQPQLPIKLSEYRSKGYPSEYAYAQATGALNIKQQMTDEASPPIISSIKATTAAAAVTAPIAAATTLKSQPVPSHTVAPAVVAGTPSHQPISHPSAITGQAFRSSVSGAPFGTDDNAVQLSSSYDDLERQLTSLMTEKSSLQDEAEKLHQRGGKKLLERTRLNQVEVRIKEVSKGITAIRKELSLKPN